MNGEWRSRTAQLHKGRFEARRRVAHTQTAPTVFAESQGLAVDVDQYPDRAWSSWQ